MKKIYTQFKTLKCIKNIAIRKLTTTVQNNKHIQTEYKHILNNVNLIMNYDIEQKHSINVKSEHVNSNINISIPTSLSVAFENCKDLFQLAQQENDISMMQDCLLDLSSIHSDIKKCTMDKMMNNNENQYCCYVEIIAGAGGSDAL